MRGVRTHVSAILGIAAAPKALPAPAQAHLPPGPCALVLGILAAGNVARASHDDEGATDDVNRAIALSPHCADAGIDDTFKT